MVSMGLLPPRQEDDLMLWKSRIFEDDVRFERCWQEMDSLLFQAQHSVDRLDSFTRVFQRCAGLDLAESVPQPALGGSGHSQHSSNDNQYGDFSRTSLQQTSASSDLILDGRILDALTKIARNTCVAPRLEEQEQTSLGSNAPPPARRVNMANQSLVGGFRDMDPMDNDGSRLLMLRKSEEFIAQKAPVMLGALAAMSPQLPRPHGLVQEEASEIPPDDLPSVGSAGHFTKQCKPCVFLYNGICLKGVRCQFCHISHEADAYKRVRPSKRTRNLLRQHNPQASGEDDTQ